MNRPVVFLFAAMFLLCTAYRIVPYEMRPEWLGAPQLAMAVFAGSIIRNRRLAFALPLFSMLLSDVVMQLFHAANPAFAPGFYSYQVINYLLILSTTVIGFFVNQRKPSQIVAGALAAPVVYFLLSNFEVWAAGHSLGHPRTFSGLLQTYVDGLLFLKPSIVGTLIYSGIFFGGKALFGKASYSIA